jgi:hypothetical protein
MSALPPKTDIVHGDGNVRFVPLGDIAPLQLNTSSATAIPAGPVGMQKARGLS